MSDDLKSRMSIFAPRARAQDEICICLLQQKRAIQPRRVVNFWDKHHSPHGAEMVVLIGALKRTSLEWLNLEFCIVFLWWGRGPGRAEVTMSIGGRVQEYRS